LPTRFEVTDSIAGDASVNKVQVVSWIFSQQEIGDEVDVAETEGAVCTAVPVGVGDTVADEENCLVVLQVELIGHFAIVLRHRGHFFI